MPSTTTRSQSHQPVCPGSISHNVHENTQRPASLLCPNRVFLEEAFEVLEPDDGKLSRPVLRGPGPAMGSGYSITMRPWVEWTLWNLNRFCSQKACHRRSSAKKLLLILIDLSLSTTKYVILAAALRRESEISSGFSEGLVAAPARAGAALQKWPVLKRRDAWRGGRKRSSGCRQSSGATESIESWRR